MHYIYLDETKRRLHEYPKMLPRRLVGMLSRSDRIRVAIDAGANSTAFVRTSLSQCNDLDWPIIWRLIPCVGEVD